MRLFACMGLLRIDATLDEWHGLVGTESTIVQFTESAIALGEKVTRAAISFLARYAPETDDTQRCRLSAVALLILMSEQHVVADDETTEWLIATIRGEHVELDEWEAWRLGPCHLFQGCLRKQKWRALTQEHLLGSQQSNVKIKSLAQDLLGTV